MSNILEKFKGLIGIEEEIYGDEYSYEEYPDNSSQVAYAESQPTEYAEQNHSDNRTYARRQASNRAKKEMENNAANNVIGMPGLSNEVAEVVIIEPKSFDEMPEVIQTLRERRSVVLNLNAMQPEEAQRAVDFVAGGTYAMDGHQERIGESIFLFTPSCVKVSTLSETIHNVPEIKNNSHNRSDSNNNWSAETARMAQ